MSIEQQTIANERRSRVWACTRATGAAALPAGASRHGIRFRRTRPRRRAGDPGDARERRGDGPQHDAGAGEARVATVEHLLAAVTACEIDNLVIEIDAGEVPIGDGSFAPFFDVLRQAGCRQQGTPARVLELKEAVRARARRARRTWRFRTTHTASRRPSSSTTR
jgi:UDP-3-O-acyl-N-acetylglucosamine deacetylase